MKGMFLAPLVTDDHCRGLRRQLLMREDDRDHIIHTAQSIPLKSWIIRGPRRKTQLH